MTPFLSNGQAKTQRLAPPGEVRLRVERTLQEQSAPCSENPRGPFSCVDKDREWSKDRCCFKLIRVRFCVSQRRRTWTRRLKSSGWNRENVRPQTRPSGKAGSVASSQPVRTAPWVCTGVSAVFARDLPCTGRAATFTPGEPAWTAAPSTARQWLGCSVPVAELLCAHGDV